MIMELRKVPAAGTKIEIEECGLVSMRMPDGEEILFWLSEADDGEIRRLILFLKGEVQRLVENRVDVWRYLKTINGVLDMRVNMRACGLTANGRGYTRI